MTPTALEARLRAVRPVLLVVADRHLARLLRRRLDLGIPTATAHDIPYRLTREELLDDDVLAERTTPLPVGDVLVVAEPDDLHVDRLPEPLLLREYWKFLFFDAVEDAVRGTRPEPRHCAVIDEARFVLEQDHRIAERASDARVWQRLLAHLATRATFEPETVAEFFPAAGTVKAVHSLWPASLDITELLARTRPDGAEGPLRPGNDFSSPPPWLCREGRGEGSDGATNTPSPPPPCKAREGGKNSTKGRAPRRTSRGPRSIGSRRATRPGPRPPSRGSSPASPRGSGGTQPGRMIGRGPYGPCSPSPRRARGPMPPDSSTTSRRFTTI